MRRLAASRPASTLVMVDHASGAMGPSTLAAITAAGKLGGDVTCLVVGQGVAGIAAEAGAVSGVTSVLAAETGAYGELW